MYRSGRAVHDLGLGKKAFASVTPMRTSDAVERRLAAIALYRILDSAPESDFNDVAALAAAVCRTPFAAISFVTDDRQWFKAEIGLGIRETPIEQSFCAHAIESDGPFVVHDATADPLFIDNPLVTGDTGLRFYAGMPLLAEDGTPIAALCVLDTKPRAGGLTEHETEALRVLGRQLEQQLALRRAIHQRDDEAALQRAMTERLRWLANHDPLTELPNRALLQKCLDDAIDDAVAMKGQAALLVIDVDHFKLVNDQFGHGVGDKLLHEVGKRLRDGLAEGATVARRGGDEFAAVIPRSSGKDGLHSLLDTLLEQLRRPLSDEHPMVDCRSSIGIALFPEHAGDPVGLMKAADLSLLAAKSGGRDRGVVFHADLADHAASELAKLAVARAALASDSIYPYYQPKFDLRTGMLSGFEALFRWRRLDGQTMTPETVGNAFNDRDLSGPLGARILARVLSDIHGWIDAGIDVGHVAINTVAADFAGDDYAERLLAALAEANVPPPMIQVEITESVTVGRGGAHVRRALGVLGKSGIRVALDDFGTGFASLSHLKQYPVDALKIDRNFVAGLGINRADTAIVRAIITLSQALCVETVAEGVETVAQADFLRANGCTIGQGFLFGSAQPAHEVAAMVSATRTRV